MSEAAEDKPVARRRRTFWLPEVATVLLGAITVAAFFGRMGWRWELTTHFRLQYFWLLAIAAAILLYCRRWKWGAAAIVLAGVNLATIVPLYFGPGHAAIGGERLKLLTANVWYKNHDPRLLLELVRREDPDILLLFEISPAWAEALAELAKKYPYSRALPRTDAGGIALFSRVPVVSQSFQFLRGMPTIVARLTTESGPLTLVCAHPSSPSSAEEFETRNHELAALARIMAREKGARILIGDFNSTGWSPYFHDLVKESGLRDSRLGFGVQPTWPRAPLPARIPIDHCLVSSEIDVLNRRVGPDIGSDHRPVIVDVEVSEGTR